MKQAAFYTVVDSSYSIDSPAIAHSEIYTNVDYDYLK